MITRHPGDATATPRDLSRVLALSASAGYVRAGQALERALVATRRVGEVRHVDVRGAHGPSRA